MKAAIQALRKPNRKKKSTGRHGDRMKSTPTLTPSVAVATDKDHESIPRNPVAAATDSKPSAHSRNSVATATAHSPYSVPNFDRHGDRSMNFIEFSFVL